MAHDLILGTSPRNWSRNTSVVGASPSPTPSPSLGRKLVLGTLVAGTGLGLVGIMGGWWAATGQQRPVHRDINPTLFMTRSPSGRIIMNPAFASAIRSR